MAKALQVLATELQLLAWEEQVVLLAHSVSFESQARQVEHLLVTMKVLGLVQVVHLLVDLRDLGDLWAAVAVLVVLSRLDFLLFLVVRVLQKKILETHRCFSVDPSSWVVGRQKDLQR